jgi:outer membrane protein assembly factor BamD
MSRRRAGLTWDDCNRLNNTMKSLTCMLLALLMAFTASCSSKPAVKPTAAFDPEKSFEKANKLIEDKDYKQARELLLEVKNRDLTKKFAPLAQLRIADSYVKEEEPELAVSEYRKFLEIYPDHRYAPYAQYEIAIIYFNQIEGYERGYGEAAKALEEFEKLKKDYPRNPYREVVELKISKCKGVIADYELMVGEFYMKKGNYQAAINRFEGILKSYPETPQGEKVLYELGVAYKKAGNRERSAEYLKQLLEKYPGGKYASRTKKELSSLDADKK